MNSNQELLRLMDEVKNLFKESVIRQVELMFDNFIAKTSRLNNLGIKTETSQVKNVQVEPSLGEEPITIEDMVANIQAFLDEARRSSQKAEVFKKTLGKTYRKSI